MDTNELQRLILNLVRKGTIAEVDHASAKCRVATGDLTTNWISWMALAAGQTRDWNPPTVGEQVLLFCPGGDPAEGLVLRGIYTEEAPPPSDQATFHTRTYPDGAVIEYDHQEHALTATFPEGATILLIAPAGVEVHTTKATIHADEVTLDTPSAIVTGDLQVAGGITAGKDVTTSADVKAGSISLKSHQHLEQGDGKKVSAPL